MTQPRLADQCVWCAHAKGTLGEPCANCGHLWGMLALDCECTICTMRTSYADVESALHLLKQAAETIEELLAVVFWLKHRCAGNIVKEERVSDIASSLVETINTHLGDSK